MSKVESLYKDYVQKSKMFLYPALNIKRGHSVTPIQTYSAWQNHYSFGDCKLICVYYLRSDEEFRLFEKQMLFGNPLFHDFKPLENGEGAYVFDFSKYKSDWDNFIIGAYSRLSPDLKRKIRSFFGNVNLGYINSFLYPDRYFKLYAELLTSRTEDYPEMLRLLKEVGELCSCPDLEKENLTADVKILHLSSKSV